VQKRASCKPSTQTTGKIEKNIFQQKFKTDLQSVLRIIFESILTTFELSVVLWGSSGSIENRIEPKTQSLYAIRSVQWVQGS